MQKYFFIILTVFIVGSAQAQNSLKAIIKSEQTKEPISGVSVTINSMSRMITVKYLLKTLQMENKS